MRLASEIVNVDELLRIAGPSVEFRTRTEVLGESPASSRCRALQEAILDDPLVREVFSWRREDGWLGDTFHGFGGIEAGIRILCEKGLSRDHPILARALDALAAGDDRLHLGIGKGGCIVDEAGVGGQEMIRAAVFSYARDEARACVKAQIAEALRGFEAVLGVRSIAAITARYREKLVFLDGVCWPSIYHLRLLARTQSWRDERTLGRVAEAVERLVGLSPIPQIYLKHRSQLYAPASYAMNDFSNDLAGTSGFAALLWFQRTELLARLGVVFRVPALEAQIARLADTLEDGLLTRRFSHSSFRDWGAYAGLALERDWRAPSRRIADLTFRALLILHHAAA